MRDGNILELASQKLSVAEACSGIRSLLMLTFLSLVYAYFFDNRVWMRWALFFCTIPIAILANAGPRHHYRNPQRDRYRTGPRCAFTRRKAFVIFGIAFACLALTHWLISKAISFRSHPVPAVAT